MTRTKDRFFTVLLLFVIAVISNAVMDVSAQHHGGALCRITDDSHVQQWFNCSGDSWLNKYIGGKQENGFRTVNVVGIDLPYPVQVTDAFHFFKMVMIMALCAILSLYLVDLRRLTRSQTVDFLMYWTATGILWGAVFNLFYHHVLN
jgi:hypothetical protein